MMMQHLKWIALPPAGLGLILLFFGLLWVAAVQLLAGAGLLALAAAVWRTSSGAWPFAQP